MTHGQRQRRKGHHGRTPKGRQDKRPESWHFSSCVEQGWGISSVEENIRKVKEEDASRVKKKRHAVWATDTELHTRVIPVVPLYGSSKEAMGQGFPLSIVSGLCDVSLLLDPASMRQGPIELKLFRSSFWSSDVRTGADKNDAPHPKCAAGFLPLFRRSERKETTSHLFAVFQLHWLHGWTSPSSVTLLSGVLNLFSPYAHPPREADPFVNERKSAPPPFRCN